MVGVVNIAGVFTPTGSGFNFLAGFLPRLGRGWKFFRGFYPAGVWVKNWAGVGVFSGSTPFYRVFSKNGVKTGVKFKKWGLTMLDLQEVFL